MHRAWRTWCSWRAPFRRPGCADLQTKVAPTFFDAVDFAPDGVMTIDPEKAIALFYADCDADRNPDWRPHTGTDNVSECHADGAAVVVPNVPPSTAPWPSQCATAQS